MEEEIIPLCCHGCYKRLGYFRKDEELMFRIIDDLCNGDCLAELTVLLQNEINATTH